MAASIEVPLALIEAVASLRLPECADRQLQRLMDRNNEGQLSDDEQDDLYAWVMLSLELAIVRAQAMHALMRGIDR